MRAAYSRTVYTESPAAPVRRYSKMVDAQIAEKQSQSHEMTTLRTKTQPAGRRSPALAMFKSAVAASHRF